MAETQRTPEAHLARNALIQIVRTAISSSRNSTISLRRLINAVNGLPSNPLELDEESSVDNQYYDHLLEAFHSTISQILADIRVTDVINSSAQTLEHSSLTPAEVFAKLVLNDHRMIQFIESLMEKVNAHFEERITGKNPFGDAKLDLRSEIEIKFPRIFFDTCDAVLVQLEKDQSRHTPSQVEERTMPEDPTDSPVATPPRPKLPIQFDNGPAFSGPPTEWHQAPRDPKALAELAKRARVANPLEAPVVVLGKPGQTEWLQPREMQARLNGQARAAIAQVAAKETTEPREISEKPQTPSRTPERRATWTPDKKVTRRSALRGQAAREIRAQLIGALAAMGLATGATAVVLGGAALYSCSQQNNAAQTAQPLESENK
ncbi:hypothetical protein KKC94_04735 [Patescibacteria group bacterium]|nr:hypothetical protein [Patescibacteria group bacterium]